MAPVGNQDEEADTLRDEPREEAETTGMEGRNARVKGATVTGAIDAAPSSKKRKNA